MRQVCRCCGVLRSISNRELKEEVQNIAEDLDAEVYGISNRELKVGVGWEDISVMIRASQIEN